MTAVRRKWEVAVSRSEARTIAQDWPRLDRVADAACRRALIRFEAAVAEGADVVGAWVTYRTTCRARALLAEKARTAAAGDEALAARISQDLGLLDFAGALERAIEAVAAERAEEALRGILNEE